MSTSKPSEWVVFEELRTPSRQLDDAAENQKMSVVITEDLMKSNRSSTASPYLPPPATPSARNSVYKRFMTSDTTASPMISTHLNSNMSPNVSNLEGTPSNQNYALSISNSTEVSRASTYSTQSAVSDIAITSSKPSDASPIDIGMLEQMFFGAPKHRKMSTFQPDDDSIDQSMENIDEITLDVDLFRNEDAAARFELNPSARETTFDPNIMIEEILSVPAKTLARARVDGLERQRQVDKGPEHSPNDPALQSADYAAKMTLWISHEILETVDVKIRLNKLCHFITTAKCCVSYGDFNGAKCIITGLQHSPVHRLERTWAMLGRQERQLYEKISAIVSPEDNAYNYRKALGSKSAPVVPFLGVHLGDLVYMNEVKRKESSKGDMEAARQRESQMARLIDQLLDYQTKCHYDFTDIGPVQRLFTQEKFINELQTFAEDFQYSMSYQLEPKNQKSNNSNNNGTIAPSNNHQTMLGSAESIKPRDYDDMAYSKLGRSRVDSTDAASQANQVDLMSLSLTDFRKSFSVENLSKSTKEQQFSTFKPSKEFTPMQKFRTALSATPSNTSNDGNQQQQPTRQKHRFSTSSSLGRKLGQLLSSNMQQQSAIQEIHGHASEEASSSSSWSQEEMKVALGSGGSVGRKKGSLMLSDFSFSSSSRGNSLRKSSRTSSFHAEWAGFFSNTAVLKEGMLQCKIKSNQHGKIMSKTQWESVWFRLFSNALLGYEKKTLSIAVDPTESQRSRDPDFVYEFTADYQVEVASDYKKKSFVFRMHCGEQEEVLLATQSEQDIYPQNSIIHAPSNKAIDIRYEYLLSKADVTFNSINFYRIR